ncbi:MAG: hypothetical protein ACYDCX_10095 [Acidithiobacillus sp.]
MFALEQYVGVASIPALLPLGKAKQFRYAAILPAALPEALQAWIKRYDVQYIRCSD